MAQFVQLSKEDCTYLLEFIQDADSENPCTEQARSSVVPKLKKILSDPRSAKLSYVEVEYLLDLLEDETLPEAEQSCQMARDTLIEIQNLRQKAFESMREIETQRELRRARRNPQGALQEHFARTDS